MKIKMYQCDNCGRINKHIDQYNEKYCYDCINIDTGELIEQPQKIFVPGSADILASEDQIKEIESLIWEKELSDDRLTKAFTIYEIETLAELTDANARKFIFNLGKLE